jgi:hypothetical protein
MNECNWNRNLETSKVKATGNDSLHTPGAYGTMRVYPFVIVCPPYDFWINLWILMKYHMDVMTLDGTPLWEPMKWEQH